MQNLFLFVTAGKRILLRQIFELKQQACLVVWKSMKFLREVSNIQPVPREQAYREQLLKTAKIKFNGGIRVVFKELFDSFRQVFRFENLLRCF